MISVDTNILIHALDEDSPYHMSTRDLLQSNRGNPNFVLCELVLVELYVLLRNPAVVRQPLSPLDAVATIERLRRHPHWQIIDHNRDVMDGVWAVCASKSFPRGRIFDIRLALNLQRHGVTEFATRNVKHFDGLGFKRVFDPADGAA